MKKEEKIVLKKVVDHHEGLLSPAEFLNVAAQRNGKLAHSLISLGFIEEVPTKLHERDYIFYRASEKGRSVFYPFYRKLWYLIRGDIRTIIISTITAFITSVVALLISK